MRESDSLWTALGFALLIYFAVVLGCSIIMGCSTPTTGRETAHTYVRDNAGWDNRYSSFNNPRHT